MPLLQANRERPVATASGYVMLLLLLLCILGGAAAIPLLANDLVVPGLALIIVSTVIFLFVAPGFYLIQPNQAAAILLFGDYKGTDRVSGLRWVLPWLTRQKVRVRVHNVTSEKLKINDKRGNPVEIAQAMLRRQQAEAVIAARTRMVEGAMTMVEMALEQLSAKNVVELDDERRAAMVSNLMVVLCGEREAQPVLNTGTLYQ